MGIGWSMWGTDWLGVLMSSMDRSMGFDDRLIVDVSFIPRDMSGLGKLSIIDSFASIRSGDCIITSSSSTMDRLRRGIKVCPIGASLSGDGGVLCDVRVLRKVRLSCVGELLGLVLRF